MSAQLAEDVPFSWIETQLARMVVLKGMPGDAAPYVEVLAGFTAAELEAGVGKALRERKWFPTPSELVQDCIDARPRQTWKGEYRADGPVSVGQIHVPGLGAITVSGREWRYDCTSCDDTGWRKVPRMAVGAARVERCGCWATNATLVARRDRQSQLAASRGRSREDAT